MNLLQCLKLEEPLRVAVVGAGGKTTAVFALARQTAGRTWVSTTTHLGTDQLSLADRHFILTSEEDLDPVLWTQQKVTLLTGGSTPDDRMRGFDPEWMNKICQLAEREHASLVIEADGARSHPLKAPGLHEPVIPAWTQTVIVVVGLSAIGKPLETQWVHRPEIFSQLTGLEPGQPVTLESVIKLLANPNGGLKGIPLNAQKVALLNQTDVHPLSDIDLEQLQQLTGQYDLVISGSLASEPDLLEVIASA